MPSWRTSCVAIGSGPITFLIGVASHALNVAFRNPPRRFLRSSLTGLRARQEVSCDACIALAGRGACSPAAPRSRTESRRSAASMPSGTSAQWYEIARLDHRFERGLDNITATYTARADGGIDVLNRGYDRAKGEWREAQGKARFVGPRDRAMLEVSFFGPFYGGYNVVDLDPDYQLALVAGPTREYLWILVASARSAAGGGRARRAAGGGTRLRHRRADLRAARPMSVALVIFVATLAASLLGLVRAPEDHRAQPVPAVLVPAPQAVRHDRHQRLRARRPAAPDLQHDDVLFLRLPAGEGRSGRSRFAVLYFLGLVVSDARHVLQAPQRPAVRVARRLGRDLGGAVRGDRLLPVDEAVHHPDSAADPGAAVCRGVRGVLVVVGATGARPHQPRRPPGRRAVRPRVRAAHRPGGVSASCCAGSAADGTADCEPRQGRARLFRRPQCQRLNCRA